MKKHVIIIILLNAIFWVSVGQDIRPLIVGEQIDLYSKYNNRSYEISVFLPENYSKDSTKYSCLYLFYGGDQKFLSASGIVTALSDATWEIPKLIIVGITNMQWSLDLTPIPIKGMDKSGGGKDFLSFVTNDLFKFIDTRYKTNDHRIFMGHSFGGLFGVYSFIDNPKHFDDYILISPSIATRADYIQDAFKQKILTSNDELNNKIYFSLGSEESRMQKSSLWLLEGLESKKLKNLKWKYEVHPGKNHHTVVPISLMNGLLYVLGKENK